MLRGWVRWSDETKEPSQDWHFLCGWKWCAQGLWLFLCAFVLTQMVTAREYSQCCGLTSNLSNLIKMWSALPLRSLYCAIIALFVPLPDRQISLFLSPVEPWVSIRLIVYVITVNLNFKDCVHLDPFHVQF